MSEPQRNPPADGSGTPKGTGDTPRRPTFFQVLLVLAATVVVLVGMRLAAPILNPILFAAVLSLLVSPIYAWLKRRRVPTPVALVWLANLMGISAPEGGARSGPEPGAPDTEVEPAG
jgi:hypothetical protein